jgi:hypothetical protein
MRSIQKTLARQVALGVALIVSFTQQNVQAAQVATSAGPRFQASLPPNPANHPLVWDAMEKKITATPNQTTNQFFFTVTNRAKTDVTITEVAPSCGCTIAKLPKNPWLLKPGENGTLSATVDFAGKFGDLRKTLSVNSTAGQQVLSLLISVPITPESERRERNMDISRNDKQAILKNDCAKCHVTPALGKTGEALFQAACAICHEAVNRASMVPALTKLNKKTYPKYWAYWINNGGPSLMPAFAKEKGGFLTGDEINVLAEFLDKKFPSPTEITPVSAK